MDFYEYLLQKFANDYQIVSLNGTLGSLATNLSVLCAWWSRRMYQHLVTNQYRFDAPLFVKEHPIVQF